MTKPAKRKVLVIAGAGASMEFGMPSVGEVHDFLSKEAQEFYPLVRDPTDNLYRYLNRAIAEYWAAHVAGPRRREPNFEDVLYTIFALAAASPAGIFTGPLGALLRMVELPEVYQPGVMGTAHDILRNLGQQLVDALINDFRQRCQVPEPSIAPNLAKLHEFFLGLSEAFDCAFVTTNYDNLIYRSLPNIETGFDPVDGLFKQGRIVDRNSWPCLLHLHGSIHFDMDLIDGDIHGIMWQPDLTKQFHQNSFGRSAFRTTEGNEFPTSSIIAGYGKTEQIQRAPFRTYYSELDRLVYQAEAVLILGFSLVDAHVRNAFFNFRDGRDRPVVFIDYANDGTMLAGSNFDQSPSGASRAVQVFRAPRGSMTWLGYKHAESVERIKALREFERCAEPRRRLAIWYNGMLEACRDLDKIVHELAS